MEVVEFLRFFAMLLIAIAILRLGAAYLDGKLGRAVAFFA